MAGRKIVRVSVVLTVPAATPDDAIIREVRSRIANECGYYPELDDALRVRKVERARLRPEDEKEGNR